MPPRSRAPSKTARKDAGARRAPTPRRPATPRSAPTETRKPSITIIGAGRLGTALALALERRGYRIDALVCTTRPHARRVARLLQSRPLALAASELEQLPDSRVVIISTPDDRIADSAARLAASLEGMTDGGARGHARASRRSAAGVRTSARVALHVSGALSSESLSPLAARGFAVGSLHPLVAVSDPMANADDFAGAYFCVEGDAGALRAARSLVRSLGGRAFSVAARDKALYHASAVFAAGHLVALFDLATELLARCGFSRSEARRVLLPLARGSVSNLSHARSNAAALTGPFARADAATVLRHLAALAALDETRVDPSDAREADAREAYALLGLRSLQLAATHNVGPTRLKEMAEIADALRLLVKR